MESINERIDLVIKEMKMNKNSFSHRIGLTSATTINNIVGGRLSKPSFEILESILKTFPSIDANWLVAGIGEMYKRAQSKEYSFEPNPLDFFEEKKQITTIDNNCEKCKAMSATIQMLNMQIETLNKLVAAQNQTIELLQNKNETGKQARSA